MNRRPIDWSLRECEVTADAYFSGLRKKLSHVPFNRAAACREIAGEIGRTRGAVDFKFQNIDAILLKNGLPRMMDAVASNAQKLLEYVVLDPMSKRIEDFDAAPDDAPAPVPDESPFVPVPSFQLPEESKTPDAPEYTPVKIDFAVRDARNKKLGRSGEKWVIQLEREALIEAGQAELAARVDWVSERLGDGCGYDILSFDEHGREKFIEVKTTNAGSKTPFYVSSRELAVADQKGGMYKLYRVFDFGVNPKVFVLEGPLSSCLLLMPRAWSAVPKPHHAF